jgi:hypothetical protein
LGTENIYNKPEEFNTARQQGSAKKASKQKEKD